MSIDHRGTWIAFPRVKQDMKNERTMNIGTWKVNELHLLEFPKPKCTKYVPKHKIYDVDRAVKLPSTNAEVAQW